MKLHAEAMAIAEDGSTTGEGDVADAFSKSFNANLAKLEARHRRSPTFTTSTTWRCSRDHQAQGCPGMAVEHRCSTPNDFRRPSGAARNSPSRSSTSSSPAGGDDGDWRRRDRPRPATFGVVRRRRQPRRSESRRRFQRTVLVVDSRRLLKESHHPTGTDRPCVGPSSSAFLSAIHSSTSSIHVFPRLQKVTEKFVKRT